MAYDLIGGAQPVWLRAVMVREGDDVVTRCCVVAGGEFFPIEVRVNVPALIRQARALGIDKASGDQVGGFGSWLKKAVKTVTKSKIVKAVSSTVNKVVKSPVFQVAFPMQALGAHSLSRATGGKGVFKGALGTAADLGTHAMANVVAPGLGSAALTASATLGSAARTGNLSRALPGVASAALSFVSPKAVAALGVGMRSINVAKAGPVIASAAKSAQRQVDLGKAAANALGKKTVSSAQALPLVRQAVNIRTNIQKLAPALAKQAVLSNNVRKAFVDIAAKAKTGNADAILASNVLAKSAKALSTIQSLEISNAGGVPGLLITAAGKIVRAPKGRFLQGTGKAALTGTLYRGPKTPTLRGAFSAVSGAATSAWGGVTDPGNDIDGPFNAVNVPSGGYQLDDFTHGDEGVSGVRRKKPRPYKPQITALERQLDNCAEAYDELAAIFHDATGTEPARYDDPRVIDTQGVAGVLTP